MSENNQEVIRKKYGWGMPRKFYSPVKYYSIPILKGLFVVGTVIITFQFNVNIFPREQFLEFLIFFFSTNILAIYLILPTNAGGTNAVAIFTYITRRKHKYYSIDRNVYPKFVGHQRQGTLKKKENSLWRK